MLQEIIGDVVDALRLLKGDEVFIITFRDEKVAVVCRHGRDGS